MEIINEKSFTYILCNRHRNVLYVGATDDLKRRIYFHKKRLIEGFTKKYNVDQLVYFEAHDTIDAALIREKQLKDYRREKKINLIQQINPDWQDFYQTLGWSCVGDPSSLRSSGHVHGAFRAMDYLSLDIYYICIILHLYYITFA